MVPFGVTPVWLASDGQTYLPHRPLAYHAPAVRATATDTSGLCRKGVLVRAKVVVAIKNAY